MSSFTQTLKRPVKRIAQCVAANFGRHTRKPKQTELLLLMYHRILPSDDPRALFEEPGMMVTPETFKLHMSLIKPLFEIMHLSHWLELKNSGRKLPERVCAITFDDGWADNYEFAYPVLQELRIPATIFLVSDMIGKSGTFWPERLSHVITTIAKQPHKWSHDCLQWIRKLPVSYVFEAKNTLSPNADQLGEIIAATKIFSDENICQKLEYIENEFQLTETQHKHPLLNWLQVKQMCQSGLVEIGSHTCNHIRLTDDKELAVLTHEIASSKHVIEGEINQSVKTFCYPNGDYCHAAQALVAQNYSGAVTTESGWNTATNNSFALHRIGMHEDISNDKTSFLSRISGWL